MKFFSRIFAARGLPFSACFLPLLCFTMVAFVTQAQVDSNAIEKKRIDSILAGERLETLPGMPTTFYHAGYVVRAKTLQALIAGCSWFSEKQWPGTIFNVRLFVLDKEDWEKPAFQPPYGMPFYDESSQIMVMAAEKNALAHLNHMPDDPVTSDSIASGFDFVILHELGHYFFETQQHIRKEHWVNEFLASYFFLCYNYAKNLQPELEEHMKPKGQPPHRTLEDFEKLYGGVGPPNYDWYQRKFIQLGITLYKRFKTTVVDTVLTNFAPGGKNLDFLTLLKTIAPDATAEWLRRMQ